MLQLQAGLTHVIFAYHSKGPNNLVTLDSLAPEKLGSTTLQLIPGSGNVSMTKHFVASAWMCCAYNYD